MSVRNGIKAALIHGIPHRMVHILASGVFFTGFIKDMFSLPRPLSPPLQRITMSGSAALEYGFPSTHSANAVSVAVYTILILRDADNALSPTVRLIIELASYFYAASIVLGRLYCGMHGFCDVIVGSTMGAIIGLVEFFCAPRLDTYLQESGWVGPVLAALVIIVLVRVHPEPADDCPCFDDSVAFAGVVIGVEVGTWRFARGALAPIYASPRFSLATLGWPTVLARVAFGVLVVFAWREVAKPTLLKALPHLFRIIERGGLSLPRRFFVPASEYRDIPLRLRVDNVMPSVSDLPKLVRSFRHPGRGRSVSIGPQSAADAYETLAYRERRRRESIGSNASVRSKGSLFDLRERGAMDGAADAEDEKGEDQAEAVCSQASGVQHHVHSHHHGLPPALAEYEMMMGQGKVVATLGPGPNTADDESRVGANVDGEPELYVGQKDELGEKEMFSKLVKPRVRYDVEVVTKLVVYTGRTPPSPFTRCVLLSRWRGNV